MIRGGSRVLSAVAVAVASGVLVGTVGAGAVQARTAERAAAPAAGSAARAAVPLSDPSPEEQERLREVAGAIWTPALAAGWNMNAEVEAVLSTVTGEILRCSEAFALVPRPPAFFPGPGYLRQYWKQVRDYFLVVKENRTYRACVVTAAANYRSAIEMASMGI
ncbi:hypothetical protein [Streptomyces genisteinicus]|uniref:Uncharacterized protein n=1 Tax=Streptomyces genisteinicus TaxID=2768068 RepID=A0A7H0I1T9_9ACTN|nr:hypothetical protein [Streptomyces genisteinicus]QNP66755.1 hypothetical protein IAG43_30085 [Streptomyces genisteinicus]